jgi:hypothetical protein
MSTEQQAQAAIESTFDTLTHWFERLGAPYIPQPGCTLETDDEDWPFMPVSQVAWVGLAGAADHLDAIRHQIVSRRLFSFAQLTLCRSALVGASQAVWVLAPDDPLVRVRRARTVAAYVYEHRLKYLFELRGLYPEPDEGIEFQVSKDEQRREQLQVKRTADGQTKKDKLFTGAMIEDAVSEAFSRDSLTKNAILSWQSGSGAAHGQVWPNFNTSAMKLSGPSGNTLTSFAVGGKLSTFSNHYCAAFETAKRGWELLERRGAG